MRGRQHRADAGDDDIEPLARGGVDERAGRRGHQHAGDAADGHDRADQPALPAVRQQEHAEERADAGLHVGHEEVQTRSSARMAHVPWPSWTNRWADGRSRGVGPGTREMRSFSLTRHASGSLISISALAWPASRRVRIRRRRPSALRTLPRPYCLILRRAAGDGCRARAPPRRDCRGSARARARSTASPAARSPRAVPHRASRAPSPAFGGWASGNRSPPRSMTAPCASRAARSIALRSSRTLPGQAWRSSQRAAASGATALARRRQEVLGQRHDVGQAFAQRRQQQRHDCQPVVQVLAERAVPHAPAADRDASPRRPAHRPRPACRRPASPPAPAARAASWPASASAMSPISSRNSVPPSASRKAPSAVARPPR